jgi:hypothetical protein
MAGVAERQADSELGWVRQIDLRRDRDVAVVDGLIPAVEDAIVMEVRPAIVDGDAGRR